LKAKEDSAQYGLKNDWESVQTTLEQIIPVYDKTNRYISLGTDLKLRQRGLELMISQFNGRKFSVLDLGCGTGAMTRLFREKSKEEVLLVDPLSQMMRVATSRTNEQGLLAVYENLPFRAETLDAAMAGFSLRDARDLLLALKQVNVLLRSGGKFLIVDLSKPDSALKRSMISLYWALIAPLIGLLSSGRLGLKFGALSKTYRRLPKISDFFRLTEEIGFQISVSEFSMLGGAGVILLTKRSSV
jgi:demethylmenaquinone methyltransferase / 2-methoxy-6-polyprenyl-1,4-benzoquinol methylase